MARPVLSYCLKYISPERMRQVTTRRHCSGVCVCQLAVKKKEQPVLTVQKMSTESVSNMQNQYVLKKQYF